jgi:putative hemolysin
MRERQIAREISYASSAATRGGRTVIRVMENATGRLKLIRKVRGYAEEIASGRDFWDVVTERYGISLDVVGGSLENIPQAGPLVIVANHPYGILDGLMMGRILADRRGGDFRILANSVFRKSEDLNRVILPISFDETKEALKLNMETRAEAFRYLEAGGAIGVFPGGTVSTAARPFDRAMDPSWRTFTAKLIAKSDAAVVPIFFDGANSRLFQIASHVHATLRLGMLIREFRTRMGSPVRVVIGKPVPPERLAEFRKDPKGMMDFLRKATYDLSPVPVDCDRLGHDFDARYREKDRDREKGQADGGRHIR